MSQLNVYQKSDKEKTILQKRVIDTEKRIKMRRLLCLEIRIFRQVNYISVYGGAYRQGAFFLQ